MTRVDCAVSRLSLRVAWSRMEKTAFNQRRDVSMARFHIMVVTMTAILAKGVARSVSYLGLDVDRKRGNARLEASIGVRQGTREMYESLRSDGGHTGQ